MGYAYADGFVYLTGRKKNLIVAKSGENVSEIFPDYEYVKKKKIADVCAALQEIIDNYNQGAPAYKKIYSLKVRETESEKTPSKKIKRY